MKVVALVSGGKDSCFNMMCAVADGHEIVALANLRPQNCDELDSYMYQTVGHQAIDCYAKAMRLPLYRRFIAGSAVQQTKDYQETVEDEVEDLYQLLSDMKEEVEFEGVAVGAILSEYQTRRVLNVCGRLNLKPLAYLWQREQTHLLPEMIACQLHAILIKVAALGLSTAHLGQSISALLPHLLVLADKYGCNPCGEGGEYETLVLDCPLFAQRLVIHSVETVLVRDDSVAPVAYLNPLDVRLEDKEEFDMGKSQAELLKPWMDVLRTCVEKAAPAEF